ncbi:MAG: hypothetical protein ABL897_10260 [Hyphomicrobium sp.]
MDAVVFFTAIAVGLIGAAAFAVAVFHRIFKSSVTRLNMAGFLAAFVVGFLTIAGIVLWAGLSMGVFVA